MQCGSLKPPILGFSAGEAVAGRRHGSCVQGRLGGGSLQHSIAEQGKARSGTWDQKKRQPQEAFWPQDPKPTPQARGQQEAWIKQLQNSTTRTRTLLRFRIKETVCLSGQQRQPQECAFRDGGEERNCTGALFRLLRTRILTVDCSRDPERQQEVLREKRSAESPEAPASDTDISKLPPVARDMYEKAKYDIINNILGNF